MELEVSEIAAFLDGIVEGDSTIKINNICEISKGKTNALSFLANEKYTHFIYTTTASAVIVSKDFLPQELIKTTLIRVEDPYKSFAKLISKFDPSQSQSLVGIDKNTTISKSATIDETVYIGAYTVIGDNVKIGKNVKIYPQVFIGNNVEIDDNTTLFQGVKIYYDSIIGKNCTIHAGTIIGADGFGFALSTAETTKVPQLGNVVIEDNVEIGANCCIDRATIGSTYIRKGVKLDNLIQVGHNVEIQENTVIAAQTGIAGSSTIGKNVQAGGQVGIGGHLVIADNIKIGAQSGVASSLKKEGDIVLGSPAYSYTEYKRAYILFKRLPDIHKKIIQLELELKELKESTLIND